MSDSTILLHSALATAFTNLSSHRYRHPSQDVRSEGWTEVWGAKNSDSEKSRGSNGSEDGISPRDLLPLPPRYVTIINEEFDFVDGGRGVGCAYRQLAESPSPALASNGTSSSARLRLNQHRVAWYEQLVLRVCFLPHAVVNSSYSSSESTGPLPFLTDLRCGADAANEQNGNDISGARSQGIIGRMGKPALVGRNNPGCVVMGNTHSDGWNKDDTAEGGNGCAPASKTFLPSGSQIVDHLRRCYPDTIKRHTVFPEECSSVSDDGIAYSSLIQDKLNFILLALRYGNDPAWASVYRNQSIGACIDPNGNTSSVKERKKPRFPMWAWYQTYSERSLGLRDLLLSNNELAKELFHRSNQSRRNGVGSAVSSVSTWSFLSIGNGVDVHRAMEYADTYYATIEAKLERSNGDREEEKVMDERTRYLLGTKLPSHADTLLFAHLAEALCDVHLVMVLAKHPKLVSYFQRIYEQYFGNKYAELYKIETNSADTVGENGMAIDIKWIDFNNQANSCNQFNKVPIPIPPKKTHTFKDEPSMHQGGDFSHAIQIMQSLAPHCHELFEALEDASIQRHAEDSLILERCTKSAAETFYQWRMGSAMEFWKSSKDDERTGNDSSAKSEPDSGSTGDEQGEREGVRKDKDTKRAARERMELMKKENRNNDELWLSGVVAVTVAAVFLISSQGRST